MRVQDLMTSNVSFVQASDTIQKAAQLMESINVGSVPVCQDKKVVGIITDRDIVIKAIAKGRNFNTAISDCMSSQVVTVTRETDAHEAADLMAQHMIRRLPVVDNSGNLVGILAIADLATVDIHINEAGDALNKISQPTQSQNAIQ